MALYNGSYLLGLSTSCSVTMNREMRDTSNKDTAGWKKVLPGQKSWTMSSEHLYNPSGNYNLAYLVGLWTNGTALTVNFKSVSAPTQDYYFTGTAYITNVQMNAPNEGNVTYTIQLQGDGALTLTDPLTPP